MDTSKFSTPLSDDAPSGKNLYDSGELYDLEKLVKGKPETQFSAAEEADWRGVRSRCEELLATSRDLRVAVIYTAALFRISGFEGLAAGLGLIRAYVENLWPSIHPQLDPEDGNDPQERVNAIGQLAAPVGSAGDDLQILRTLRTTPLTVSRQAGNWGLDAILADAEKRTMLDGNTPPSSATVDGAFGDTDPDRLKKTQEAAESAVAHATAITTYFTDTVGTGNPGLNPLLKDLNRIVEILTTHIADAAPADTTAPAADGSTSSAADASSSGSTASSTSGHAARAPASNRLSGAIASREEVAKALDLINEFYRRNEPSSPIPLFIDRVKKLVPMTFPELIKELTPDAMERVTLLTGFKPPKEEDRY
jgi:type VI secretion system protein ImpA